MTLLEERVAFERRHGSVNSLDAALDAAEAQGIDVREDPEAMHRSISDPNLVQY